MLSFFNVQVLLTATALCFAGVGIAAAVALVTAPITPRLVAAGTVGITLPGPARAIGSPKPILANTGEPAFQARPVATILVN